MQDRFSRAADKLASAVDKIASREEPPAQAPAPGGPGGVDVETRRAVLSLLAKENPRYAGRNLVGEYETFQRSYADYRTKWQTANPGETFDYDAEEHAQWKERNEPQVAGDDILRAEGRLDARREAEAAVERERRKMEAREAEVRAGNAAQEAPGHLAQMLGAADLDALKAKDPQLAFFARRLAQGLSQFHRQIYEVIRPGNEFQERNPVHATIAGLIAKYEPALVRLPPENLVREGRRFATQAQYEALPKSEKDLYWTARMAPDVVAGLATMEFKRRAEEESAAWQRETGSAPPPAPAGIPASPAPPAGQIVPARPPAATPGPATSPMAPPPPDKKLDYFFSS